MSETQSKAAFTPLAILFFLQWMALAVWMVPLTLVLNAHGLQPIQPYAFATGALAAFVAPLFFGAVADRHYAPTRVLRWLCVAAALALALASTAIAQGWNALLILAVIQLHALFVTPTVSISTAIAMSGMRDARREFGPIRAMGTMGWVAGCLLISGLGADASPRAGLLGAGLWLGLALFTFRLPDVEPAKSTGHLTLRQRLGLDALTLLRHPDTRAVYLVACLICIPLAAFYPYTPPHLRDLGLERPAAWMALGQTTEILAMFGLAGLLARWRLKWILLAGLIFAVARFGMFMLNAKSWLLPGIALHGITYTLVFTTAQIYVNERVEAEWRVRAQALMTLMTSGLGHLLGYLGCGWWFAFCQRPAAGTQWPLFWGVLAAANLAVLVYFLIAYHGRGAKPRDGAMLNTSPS